MKVVLALALFVAAASASVYRSRVYYGGYFPGYCPLDGYYYNNAKSFIQCDNGKHTVRPCAPGTKNGGAESYKAGSYYAKDSVFCNEIIDPAEHPVEEKKDEGYAAPAPAYKAPAPRYHGHYEPQGYFNLGVFPHYGYGYAHGPYGPY